MPAPHANTSAQVSNRLRKILLEVGSTGFWQAAGKLAQVFGLLYAMDCLGGDNAGLSAQVMGTAMMLQVILTLGIDVIAVRHIAAKTQGMSQLLPIIFSTRLTLHGGMGLLWILVAAVAPVASEERFAWVVGSIYFVVIGMNYQWYFQATERIPTLSRLQSLTTFGTTAYFLMAFKPGQSAGSDLLVLAVGHGIVTAWVWFRVFRETGASIFTWSFFGPAWKLLKEGQANWLFGVAYNALTLLGLLLMPLLLSDADQKTQLGYFRGSNQLALALQLVLTYIGYIFYPKIVAWRRQQTAHFKFRVFGLAGIVWLAGVVSSLLLFWLGEPFFKMALKNPDFHPGFQIVPIMVMAKFIGMASGFLTWGLLAEHKDWLAVRCCLWPVLVTAGLHFIFVPRHGFLAAGWLYAIGEMLLFLSCTFAFVRLKLSLSKPK